MKDAPTKGELETAIRHAIVKFEQEVMGRGPEDVRTLIVRDFIVIRLRGVLTPAERQLARSPEGVDLVKRLREKLIEQSRDRLCGQISDITAAKATGLFTDIDTNLGERVFLFTLDRDLESSLR